MSKTRCQALLPVVALLAALSACAHTKVLNTWRDPEHQGTPKKVLVHAMAMSPTVKIMFENMLVARLKERGVAAVASNSVLPDSLVFDRDSVTKVVRENAIDAVFVTHAVERKVVETFKPGHFSYAAVATFNDDGSFVFVAGPTYTPGVDDKDKATVEHVLFDVPAKKRVWVMHTKTYVWDTRTDEVKPMVDMVMEQLRADKMIP